MHHDGMHRFPVTVRFPMHWGEMDALGHANNARFFTWFESARIAYLRRVGLDAQPDVEVGPIVKHTECDYLQPVVFPADLLVGVRVVRMGNTSFTMEHVVTLESDPDTVVARGTTVVVTVNYRTGEKVEVPEALRRAIDEVEGVAG